MNYLPFGDCIREHKNKVYGKLDISADFERLQHFSFIFFQGK